MIIPATCSKHFVRAAEAVLDALRSELKRTAAGELRHFADFATKRLRGVDGIVEVSLG